MSIATLLLLSVAQAQDADPVYGFDAHGFRFVSAGSDPRSPLRFYRPGASVPLGWSAGAVAEYAPRPLVFESDDGDRFPASSQLAAVNVAGGFTPVSGLSFDVSAPVILANTWGGAPDPYAGAYPSTSAGPTLADLRVSALAAPLRPTDGRGAGLGLVAALDLPTGAPERWLGTRGVAALLAAVATVEQDDLTASAQVGARLAPNTASDARPAPTIGGDTVEAAGALSYLLGDGFGLGVEATASVPIDAQVRAALSIPAEATLTARYRAASGAHLAAGLGVGLGAGAGASPVRAVLGGGFGTAAAPTPRDTDGDGLADRDDACPTEAEARNGYRDDDGCTDALPRAVVEARAGDAPAPEAALTATRAGSDPRTGTGQVSFDGLPGDKVTVAATLGACRAGTVEVSLPEEGEATVALPLARSEATVSVTVSDATGRPVQSAQVRYVIDEEYCRPADTAMQAGRGTHVMGSGPVKLFVTAMGYDVYQTSFELAAGEQKPVDVKLKPTAIALKDGRVKMTPSPQFLPGTATLDARALATMQQVAAFLIAQEQPIRLEIAAWAEGPDAATLSRARADAMKDQLVILGVAPEMLTPAGKGAPGKDQKDLVALIVQP